MKIAWVHPRRCMIEEPLRAGEVRRTFPAPGALLAYDVGCPSCGFRNLWRAGDDAAFEEGLLVDDTALVELPRGPVRLGYRHPATLSMAPALPCIRCGMAVRIAGEEISAA